MQADEAAEQGRTRRAWGLAGLAVVLGIALALRLVGITWGLPDSSHLFSYHPDEFHSLRGALALALGDPNPHFFNYGSLYLYLVAAAAAIAHPALFTALPDAGPGDPTLPAAISAWTLDARAVTLLTALASVAVVCATARAIWGRRCGLTAGLLLALMPLHVLHSHYATVDVPGALFVALALMFAVRMVREPVLRNALWAGAAAGLAASVKYSGGLALVAPLAAWVVVALAARGAGARRPSLAALVLPPLVALGAFALTSPYTLLDWPAAWRDIRFEMQHMETGDDPAMIALWPNGWLFHLHELGPATGFAALAAAAVGLTSGLASGRRELLPLVAFGVLAFVVMGSAQVRYARYEIALLPVLAVFAGGVGSDDLYLRARGRLSAAAVAVAMALLLFASVLGAVSLDHRMLRELTSSDPRARALEVIRQQVPAEGSVGLISEPWFYHPPVDYCNGGPALRSNPVWSAYRRPVRELHMVGLDPAALEEGPDAVVVTGFEVDAPLQAGDARVRAFVATLPAAGYACVFRSRGSGPPWSRGRAPASDWLYPFPRIEVWLNTGAAAGVEP
ncbi:MAG: glycosyltransferase family 39 protein [Armatimonadota bacterium]